MWIQFIIGHGVFMKHKNILFLVSSRQSSDPHWSEAGEHFVCVQWLVLGVLSRGQEEHPQDERHQGQADWLRLRHVWLGAPLQRGQHQALQTSRGHPGAGLVSTMWCVEHRLHCLRTLPGEQTNFNFEFILIINIFRVTLCSRLMITWSILPWWTGFSEISPPTLSGGPRPASSVPAALAWPGTGHCPLLATPVNTVDPCLSTGDTVLTMSWVRRRVSCSTWSPGCWSTRLIGGWHWRWRWNIRSLTSCRCTKSWRMFPSTFWDSRSDHLWYFVGKVAIINQWCCENNILYSIYRICSVVA